MVAQGQNIPTDVKLTYIPYAAENDSILACSIPIAYDLAKQFPGKKVVIVSVPGAFTPTCTANHIPPFIAGQEELKKKGVDQVIVLAANDAFVQAAWGKALGNKDNFVIFASDPLAALSAQLELSVDLSEKGFGVRTSRYALIVEDGVITYVGKQTDPGVTVSGYDAVLAAL